MNFQSGHKNTNGFYVRLNPSGTFGWQTPLGDTHLQDLAENSEFLYAASSQIKVNLSKTRNPFSYTVKAKAKSLVQSFGPFPMMNLPDMKCFLYVSAEGYFFSGSQARTGSVEIRLRQAPLRPGGFFSTSEVGAKTISSSTSQAFKLNTPFSSISVSSSFLETQPEFTLAPTYASYISRSVTSSFDRSNETMCYLDVYASGTWTTLGNGTFFLTKLFAMEYVPPVSGTYAPPFV